MGVWRVAFHPHRRRGQLLATGFLDPTKTNGWDHEDQRKRSAWLTSRCQTSGNVNLAKNSARTRDSLAGGEILSKLCQQGQVAEAVEALGVLVQTECRVPQSMFYTVLKTCVVKKDLVLGRRVHALSVIRGYKSDTFLCNHIVRMYASHGRLQEAMDVFTVVAKPDAFMWSSMISAYVNHGQAKLAIRLYHEMLRSGAEPDGHVYVAALQACARSADLETGQQVHADVLASALVGEQGLKVDVVLGGSLVNMYAKCGSLEDAQRVFDGLEKKTVVTWNAMIAGYSQQGMGQAALGLHRAMELEGIVTPDSGTFVCLLQACASVGTHTLEKGKQLHTQIREQGLQDNVFVANSLVNMYAKCGSLDEAQRVFDGIGEKDVITWTSLITGYSQLGMGQEALHLFSAMQEEGIAVPDAVAFGSLLHACASVGAPALEMGKQLHDQIVAHGPKIDVVVGCSLVNMYAKCGSLEDAQGVFDALSEKNTVLWTTLIAGYAKCGSLENAQRFFNGLSEKDAVTWNTMIAGYAQQGMLKESLYLYKAMQDGGTIAPNTTTFVCILQACSIMGTLALEEGRQLHAHIRERGLQADVFVANSLIDMYAKCGSLEEAQRAFDEHPQKDAVTWNTMIAGYSHHGMGREALHVYRDMQEEGTVAPNSVTYVCLLQACASVGNPALGEGQELHSQIRERGLQADISVTNSLVYMYAKCGSLEDAQSMFDGLSQKDVVTWNAMIAGYSQQGLGQEALRLYFSMQQEGVVLPDSVTFVCLLQACADVACLHVGRQLHAQIVEQGLQGDGLIAVSLINMYSKSASMVDAQQVFEALPERDAMAWNSLIAGYTRQGDSEVVIDLFRRMRQDGVEPASITFLNVLTVCSHAGLVKKAREYFEAMSGQYGITPTAEHYTSMVDLLGRAGQMDEALSLVRSMPVLPDAAVWRTLLGACQKWSDVEVARHAFDEAVKLDKRDAAAYVLMSNIYTSAQMWEQAQEMQVRRTGIGAWKEPGQSLWTDIDGVVHSFLVGGIKHPESESIYARLEQLLANMKDTGGCPSVGLVMAGHN